MAFHAGLRATPYDTVDTAGNSMGFNDPFTAQHYRIIWQNASFSNTLNSMGLYEWGLIAVHAIGILLLARRRPIRSFFIVQVLIFPLGFLGFIILFYQAKGYVTASPLDREFFVDIPYVKCTAHAIWLLAALTIGIWLHVLTVRSNKKVVGKRL